MKGAGEASNRGTKIGREGGGCFSFRLGAPVRFVGGFHRFSGQPLFRCARHAERLSFVAPGDQGFGADRVAASVAVARICALRVMAVSKV